MKTRMMFALAVVTLIAVSSLQAAGEKKDEKKVKLNCPVSGKAAKQDKTAAFKGGKVAFCCPNCIKAFKKDSTKFASKATAQLVQTKQFEQKCCPISGAKKLNPATALKVAGAEVTFCCKNCKGKVAKADKKEKLEMVFNSKKKPFVLKKKDKKKTEAKKS